MPANQEWIDSVLLGRGRESEIRVRAERVPGEPTTLFSAFVDTELERPFDLSQRFSSIADESGIDSAVAAIPVLGAPLGSRRRDGPRAGDNLASERAPGR